MPTSYTSLLGLALPVTGELSGTWGDTVNDYITQYLDASVAGTQTISGSQTAVTLSKTTATSLSQAGSGATGSSQYMIINCTGNPASMLTITAPAASKPYIVINGTSTSQDVKIVGVGPTTGVTLVSGEKAVIAWNGSDFTKIATSTADGVTSISFGSTGLTPSTTTTGAVTVAGTLATGSGGTGLTTFTSANNAIYSTSSSALTAGTLPVAAGGTGATTLTSNSVILGNGTSAVQFVAPGTTGNVLTSNGTTWTSAVLPAGGLTYVYKTSNYTTQDKEGVLADTSGGAFTVTLPATPSTGAQVVVADAGSNWGTNNLTVGRNGSTIGGLAENLVCDITGASVQLVYDGTTWEVYAQIGGNGGNAATQPGNNAFTGANTFYNATGQTFGTATSTQDGIILAGRAGGSSSYRVTLQPGTLSASRTVTLPDANINFTTGLGVAQGGTGATSLTANNVLLGNGTSALQVVAPGTSGNVLTSDGTTWTSAAPAGGAWTFISSQTASSSATISFTNIGSTYDVYAIQLVRVVPNGASRYLQLLTSTDNGSTYASASYGFASIKGDGNSSINTYGSTATSTFINLTPATSISTGDVDTAANLGVSGWIYLWKPSEAAQSVITYDLVYRSGSNNFVRITGCASQNTAADVDAVRFQFSAGLLSTGTFRIYGIKNS